MAKKYTVRYEQDEDGRWVASVPGVDGCRTQGRSISQARTRIREALALFVKDAATAELVDDIAVPTGVRRKIERLRDLQAGAKEAEAAAAALAREVAAELTEELELSVRDAGEILDVSGGRVQQLLLVPTRTARARAVTSPFGATSVKRGR